MKVHNQFKAAAFSLALAALITAPSVSPTTGLIQYQQATAADEASSMAKIQLILKKLRGSMSSMKDFDELEKAGMPKSDVDRMRRAMAQKTKQLTDDAINSIQSL